MATTLELALRPKAPPVQGEVVSDEYGTPPVVARDAVTGAMLYDKFYQEKASEWCQNVWSSSSRQSSEDPGLSDIPKWIRVLSGEHWLAGRPSYRSTPVVNRIAKFWWELQSTIADVPLNTYVRSQNPAFKDMAENATKVCYANWLDQDGDLKMMSAVQHASFGLGFTKVGIRPGMVAEDLDVTFLPAGSDEVVLMIPNLNNLQDSGGAIYSAWKPVSWFQKRFTLLQQKIQPEVSGWTRGFPARPFNIPEYTWSIMNPGLRQFLADPSEGRGKGIDEAGRVPMARLREFWFHDDHINTSKNTLAMGAGNFTYLVKPGEPIYPYGRLICAAGEDRHIPLSDGPNFHWHGMMPFADLRLKPVVWAYAGLSCFNDLFPLNQCLNQTLADFQDYLRQILNPTVLSRDHALSPDAWEELIPGRAGAKIRLMLQNSTLAEQFAFLRPDSGALAPVMQAIPLFLRLFDEQAGLVDTGQMMRKKQVPSSESIEQIQSISQSLFRLMSRFVAVHMKRIGKMQVSDILQFYTKKKMVWYLGPDGETWQHLDWDPETLVEYTRGQEPFRKGRELVSNFRHMVTTGTSLPAQRTANANNAINMFKIGILDPESLYAQLSAAGFSVPEWSTVKEKLKKYREEFSPPVKGQRGGKAQGMPLR